MKTKVKRLSKRTLAVFLGVMMLVTSIGIGSLITANATTYYAHYVTDNSKNINNATTTTMTAVGDGTYYFSFTTTNSNFDVTIGTTSSPSTSSCVINTSTTTSGNSGVTIHNAYSEGGGYYWTVGWATSGTTVYFIYNPTNNTVSASTTAPSGSGSGGSGGSGASGTATKITDDDLIAVIRGTKIYIYFGDEWGAGTKYAKTSTSGAANVTKNSSISGSYNGSSNTQYLAYGAVTTGATYSVSNTSSWEGVNISTPTAGYMYALWSGSNYWTNSKAPTITWSTQTDTIVYGDNSCDLSATSSGYTGIDATTTVKYFYTSDDSSYYEFDPSDLPSLDPGTYTVYAAAYDGYIYVMAGSTGTLTVSSPTYYNITANSNDDNYGTVSVDNYSAYSGQTVNITCTEITGEFDSITAYKTCDTSTTVSLTEDTAGNAYHFTMPDYDVTINAVFTEYSAQSDYYYNGYNSSGSPKSGYFGKRMTEAKLNGKTYSYYHVTDRTESDQLFTVSYGNLDYTNCYVYWTRPSNWGDTWSNWDNQFAMFYSSDQTMIQDWTNMEGDGDTDGGYKLKTLIPDGARYVRFKDGKSQNQTVLIDLNNGGKNGFYLAGGKTGNDYNITAYDNTDYLNRVGNIYEYYNGDGIYTSNYDTKGFYNHNATRGASHAYTKPKDLSDYKSDYYILLFYKDVEYSYNGVTRTNTSNIEVIWASELPGDDSAKVRYYAKDGVIRDAGHSSFAIKANTTVTASDGVTVNTATEAYTDASYVTGKVTKGKSITVTTTIADEPAGTDTTNLRQKYYVAGYSFNGVTPELLSWNSNGVYTCTYTVPEDFSDNYLEITPIYFLKDSSNAITFNIAGYDDVKDNGWGDTLFVYPFYKYYANGSDGTTTEYDGQAENYRAYPGQPCINYGGRIYAQIPLTHNGTANGDQVKGITINNGYLDSVHALCDSEVSDHRQTYDYDDFYKIYKENESTINSIWFTFKYETEEQHRVNAPTSESSTFNYDGIASTLSQSDIDAYNSKNGFEDLVNVNGKKVDLFGNVLTGTALEADPIYVISQGYEANNAGKFATEWDVFYYDSGSGNYIKITDVETNGKTSIVPSALHLKTAESFNNYTALDGDLAMDDYEGIYTALQNYSNRPVKITYEQDAYGGYKSDGRDLAYRCDGIWSYTLTSDYISGTVEIEYSDDNGSTWTAESSYDGSVGDHTSCDAHFTYVDNSTNGYSSSYDGAREIKNVYIDESKYFTFEAETAGTYEFVGWKLKDASGSYSDIPYDSSDNSAMTNMSSTVTLVARFNKVSSGSLTISHSLLSGSSGLGTTYLGIEILDSENAESGATIADVSTNTSAKTLGSKYIASNSDKYIRVTIKTLPKDENTFKAFSGNTLDFNSEATAMTSTYLSTGSASTDGNYKYKTMTFPISGLFSGTTQSIAALNYYSEMTKVYNKYKLTYTFKDRGGDSRNMVLKGDLSSAQLAQYVTGSTSSKKFNSAFLEDMQPTESNFNKSINWDYTTAASSSTCSALTSGDSGSYYTISATITGTESDSTERNIQFKMPYEFNSETLVATQNNDQTVTHTEYQSSNQIKTTYGSTYQINGSYVTAPTTLVDDEGKTAYWFKCWEILTEGEKHVANCYYPEFNFTTYDDCIVKAIYSEDEGKYYTWFNDEESVSAVFLGDTRNQYNNDSTSGLDMIYNDFALTFRYKGVELYKETDTSKYDVGVVAQRVQSGVDLDSSGNHTTTLTEYATKNADSVATAQEAVVAYVKGGSKPSGYMAKSSLIGQLDNKNRLEYGLGLMNSKIWDENGQSWTVKNGVTNGVYRLFAYVYDKNGNTVKVSDPAYFCMYDIANS